MAPLLWRSEFRNILAGYMRRTKLGLDEACAMQAEAEALLAANEFEVDSRRVLELVRDSDSSAYDCEFVALAMNHGIKLVTMDSKLLASFPETAIGLIPARTPRRGPGR